MEIRGSTCAGDLNWRATTGNTLFTVGFVGVCLGALLAETSEYLSCINGPHTFFCVRFSWVQCTGEDTGSACVRIPALPFTIVNVGSLFKFSVPQFLPF